MNIGGWLVPEPWITPSLFINANDTSVVDPFTFCAKLGVVEATRRLHIHWETFYSESDFAAIAAAGLTHIRIPVGFWEFDVRPFQYETFAPGGLPYLFKALTWAKTHGLKVVIDLHCCPGSQNGFDNSGRRLDPPDHPHWQDEDPLQPGVYPNIVRTLNIIKLMTQQISAAPDSDAVVAFQPVNEPAAFKTPFINLERTKNFYNAVYDVIRSNGGQNWTVVISDAFDLRAFDNFWSDKSNVVLDTHIYHMFDMNSLQMSPQQHVDKAAADGQQIAQCTLPTITGEWCLATTDCALYLTGVGEGTRWEGTLTSSPNFGSPVGTATKNACGNPITWDPGYTAELTRFFIAQTTAYEKGLGWFFWTAKTEQTQYCAAQWDYLAGVRGGWIPVLKPQ